MEKLDQKDRRFLAACVLVIAASGLVTARLFRRAFPEATIEFRVNRDGARRVAEAFLKERGRDIGGHRFAGRFDVAETPKVYLERTLGLEKAGRLYGRDAKVWLWEMRWFRSGVKEEEQVAVSPLGDLVSWESVRREDAPGARLPQEAARALAVKFLEGRGLPAASLEPIEATPQARPKRIDWTFVDEKRGLKMGEATVRYATTVAGGEVAALREFVHVPEAWTRDYERLRSKNSAAGAAATVGLLLTLVAMIAVLIAKITRKDVRWKLVGAFGAAGFVLALLSSLNDLPLTLYSYDTASSLESHLAKQLVFAFFGALGTAAFVALVAAAAEPIYRERFPRQPSLSGTFSRRGIRTKRFFLSVVLGYALTAFFFAYQAVFYVVADRFGAWAPAEVPFDDMLNTAFPWATVLLIGFLPAVSEEGMSRMFSISFLDRLGAGRVLAVVVPAFIWGFGHSGYPNQPFYIRGLEVGFAGVLIGALMLRYGVVPLLVWHFTVDATYTALLMLRSGNAYYVASGAVAAGILLAPLAACLALALRRGGFEPEAGLTNGEEGFVPAPPPAPEMAEEVPVVRPVAGRTLALAGAVAALLACSFLLPPGPLARIADDAVGRSRAEAVARDFLEANGASPERYRVVSYTGTGFADDEAVRAIEPAEHGRIPGFSPAAARYVLQKGGPEAFRALAADKLPPAFWAVRFIEPEKKEEWKVLVDARRGRVCVFANPKEESAPAGPPPSEERARARALDAAGKLGYPASQYQVLEVGTKARPKRVDTTVVLEARPAGIGEARPRLTAVFHGPLLAAFAPSIHVPEQFLRDEQKTSPIEWLLRGVKIVAAGGIVGLGLIVFLRIVRQPEFRWKSLRGPLALAAVFGLAFLANDLATFFRRYDTTYSLATFGAIEAVRLGVRWIAILLGASVAFVLVGGARPGWRRAARTKGSLPDAFLRAAIAAAGTLGLGRWSALLAARFPAFNVPDPSLPTALEKAVPGLSVLSAAALATLALASTAAVVAIAAPQPFFRRPAARAAALLGLVFIFVPTRLHSGPEFALDLLPALAGAAWLAVAAFVLLKDHVAAWVLFGALAFGGRAAAAILGQTAAADRTAGWVGVALIVIAVVGLLAGRREAVSAEIVVGALFVTFLMAATAAAAERPGAAAVREKVRAYREAHEVEILREFADLLAVPNLASDTENIRKNAERVAATLARRGVKTELLELAGAPPIVYGELAVPGAKRTVILYAHYDGQPVDPAKWTGKPWQPVLRDGPLEAGGRDVAWETVKAPVNPEWFLYARSASDDKAPVIGLAAALDALRAGKLPLSANLKFFIEGEEEAGSPHLAAILEKYRERLKADAWLLFDGPVHQSRRMQIYFGARGITGVEITAYGPIRRLHSGHYGNWAPNPAVELARLLAGMRDDRGNILIKGFADGVRPLIETERRALAAAPDVDGALKEELALGRTEGSEGEHLLDAILRPALNLRGIQSGDVGEKATNSIPTEATASIDFRLVPDQTPEGVRAKVEAHWKALGYTLVREAPDKKTRLATPRVLRVRWESGYPSARTSMDLPVSRAVARVISESFGAPVVELPTLGGSVPMYLFTYLLKTPVVGVPIVNHDNNQHASNENIRIRNLWDGIETYAALLSRLDW